MRKIVYLQSIPVISIFTLLFLSLSGSILASSIRETPVVQVVKKCAPAVVNISTEKVAFLRQNPFWGGYGNNLDSLLQDFYNQPPMMSAVKLKNLGSGVIVRPEGVIVTNAHVINMATQIFVIFQDGRSLPAQAMLVNQQDDLALIKVNSKDPLPFLPLTKPDDILIGETVITIGNPYGLENSVSAGVISGKNRTFSVPEMQHVFTDLIQTDAPINIGNSGGALINLDGELTGINLAVVQEAQNIGFALPSRKILLGLDSYDKLKVKSSNQAPSQTTQIPVRIRNKKP